MFDSEDFYISSDLHLGHPLVSRLRGFTTTEAHDDVILRQLWSLPAGATFVCLGDIAVRKDAYALEELAKVKNALNLTMVLTPGNHDRIHPIFGPTEQLTWIDCYREVFDLTSVDLQVNRNGKWILFNHYPAMLTKYDPQSAYRWVPHADRWDCIIHGHTHSSEILTPGHVNVALEAHNMRILHSSELWKLVAKA